MYVYPIQFWPSGKFLLLVLTQLQPAILPSVQALVIVYVKAADDKAYKKEASLIPDSGKRLKIFGVFDVEQFHLLLLNWFWHSSIVNLAAFRIISTKLNCSLQNFLWEWVQPTNLSQKFNCCILAFNFDIELKNKFNLIL